jgi:hypothetical protein
MRAKGRILSRKEWHLVSEEREAWDIYCHHPIERLIVSKGEAMCKREQRVAVTHSLPPGESPSSLLISAAL